jgi:hypothetical protein
MSKFKVGDIVVCIDDQYSGPESGLARGMMYTILETKVESSYGSDFVKVNKTVWFWNPNRFELVRQVPNQKNTKVGQKVRIKNENLRSNAARCFRGQICTVKEFEEYWVTVREDPTDRGIHWDEIEFIEEKDMPISMGKQVDTNTSAMWHNGSQGACGSGGSPRTPQEEIDFLLKMANEGLAAMEKLQDLTTGTIEFSYSDSKDWSPCGKLVGCKYRIKPKPIMPSWLTSGSDVWNVIMTDDGNIQIGCKIFNAKALRYVLNALVSCNLPSATHLDDKGHFFSTKAGVKLDNHVLPWVDAERLLNELNKILENT